ncbi:uncharacterized protein LOC135712256 [Ochlerotatus camptorhynchus]|uniref:uncharacterized protein LOC135712256 n=1 Tax=Ochlerotatus camptorhynchus TaxID=644619 RepID=UPI0031D863CC
MAQSFQLTGVRTVEELLLPHQTLNADDLRQRYSYLQGLPIGSYYDARPRILIGMKHVQVSLVLKSREGNVGDPVAVKTRLGWTVCGGRNVESDNIGNLVHYTFHVCSCERTKDDELHQAVKNHFSLENLGITKPKKLLLSTEDQRAQDLLRQLTSYDGERYTTGLLWRHNNVRLPDNYAMALRRHQSLQHRLTKDPELAEKLNRMMEDYVSKGYFQENPVGLTGDLREMFHQVGIRVEDQQCQRFLWWNEKGEIVVYVMQVMTFGACCSASCAQYVKNINAERHAERAAEIIQKRHYVDDMLISLETKKEAIRIAREVKHVHQQGGFEIRNWISNSPEERTDEKDLDLTPEISTEKVLGMWWCTASDTFTYKVGWNRYDRALLLGQIRPTKRVVLRVLMSMFDPLGLISHFLMFLKVLLQEVWRSGVQWDEEITDDAFTKWQQWLKAAVVGARLSRTITDALSIDVARKYYWTDSRDVLCWLNSDHRRYTQYVAFRVSEILDLTEANEWPWVPSKMNVADDDGL